MRRFLISVHNGTDTFPHRTAHVFNNEDKGMFEVDYLFYNKVIETREMVTESEEHGTTIHSQQYAEDAAENYCLGYMSVGDGRRSNA